MVPDIVTHADDVVTAAARTMTSNIVEHGPQGSAYSFFLTEITMYLGAFAFFCFATKAGPARSLMESLNMAACAFSGMAYTVLSHGHGVIEIDGRLVCWVRYIDWAITTPLLIHNLCKLAGCRHAQMVMLCLLSMITCALLALGSLLSTKSIYALAFTTFVPVMLAFCGGLSSRASKAPSDVRRILCQLCWLSAGCWTSFLLLVFLAQSTSILTTRWENIIYSIIDITYKCGFGGLLCTTTSVLDKVAVRDDEM